MWREEYFLKRSQFDLSNLSKAFDESAKISGPFRTFQFPYFNTALQK